MPTAAPSSIRARTSCQLSPSCAAQMQRPFALSWLLLGLIRLERQVERLIRHG
jgi:hypothetical protein